MKHRLKAGRIAILLVLLVVGGSVILTPPRSKGQGAAQVVGTPVYLQPGALPTCTPINGNAAVNNAVTVTFPTPGSGSIIIYEMDFQVANDATGAVTQANVKFTTTNMNSWQFQYSSANAANTSTSFGPFYFPYGLRATAGQAPTIVSPAANTHAAYNINACYQISAQ